MADILVVIFGVTLLFASVTNMLTTIIKILIVQGLILFALTILNTNEFNLIQFIFVAVETLLFKAILIPYFLADTVKRNNIVREVEP
ncbi:MAG: hypothetical protein CVU48_01680, partial [Candidatus Cloacimonetes bacterium HGW-Cloacimonetes-1]